MSDPFSNPAASPFDSGWQQPPSTGGPPPLPADGGAWGSPPPGQTGGDQTGWGQAPQGPAPFGQQPPQAYGAPPAFGQPAPWAPGGPQPYSQPSSSSGNKVVVIVIAVVVVLVLGVVGAAVAIFSAAGNAVDRAFDGAFDGGSVAIPEGPRLLVAGGSVGTFNGTARFDFRVADSTLVQIDVIGHNGFDPVITLFGPGNVLLEEDDDGGSGFNSQVVRNLSSGTYVVEVRGFSGDDGNFDIIVTDR